MTYIVMSLINAAKGKDERLSSIRSENVCRKFKMQYGLRRIIYKRAFCRVGVVDKDDTETTFPSLMTIYLSRVTPKK